MVDRYVLDAYAVMALLGDEEGAERVTRLIESDGTEIYMSIINVARD